MFRTHNADCFPVPCSITFRRVRWLGRLTGEGGFLYMGQRPINATPYGQTARRGESRAFSILGLVAWGDASIHGAKNSEQIKEVASVDHESFNVLGVFGSYCTIVRGS